MTATPVCEISSYRQWTVDTLLESSLPLGIDPEAEYINQEFTLNDDDCLILYTDGLLEARDLKGELYGFERVNALFANRPTAEFIAETARTFGQEDDITVLTIERHIPASVWRMTRASSSLTPVGIMDLQN